LKDKWLCQINRPNFVPSAFSSVCSAHFEPECFVLRKNYRFLKAGSFPTIFTSHPNHKKPRKRKTNCPEKSQEKKKARNITDFNFLQDHSYCLQSPAFLQDHSYCLQSPSFLQDHNYFLPSKQELKSRNEQLMDQNETLRKKLKSTRKGKNNAQMKSKSLQEVIKNLKEQNLISETVEELLQKSSSKVPAQIFARLANSLNKSKKYQRKYSKELRSFAITLQFYSSKAYNYVRKTFGLCLPHENVVRRWYQTVGAEAGFTRDAFETLKKKVEEEKNQNKSVIVNLTFDEVSIKKKIEWTGTKFVGHVDLGIGTEPDDSSPQATEALVFLVTALDSSWKLSIGYFLIAGLTAEEKCQLLTTALKKLYDIGVQTSNVTCDGLAANFSTLKKLGASFDPDSLICFFPHPSDSSQKVTVMLDACHLLKLARNTLSDLKVLIDPSGNKIKWEYIEQLHKLQSKEGLRAANKLRKDHIFWQSQKMKVSLAAQTLSSSVADSIDFCRDYLKLKEFQDSQATSKFIRVIDVLFDIMNSRNALAKGYKAPMKEINKNHWSKVFSDSIDYISNLKDLQGKKLVNTPRKTAFIGLLINIQSLKLLFKNLVEEGHLKYLLTYKLSQDHIELFFSALRCRLGRNNNPTVREFKAAYKRLLLHQEINGNRGNCLLQDDTTLLSFQSLNQSAVKPEDFNDFSTQKKFGLAFEDTDHDYAQISSFPEVSEFQTSVIEYISGFTVRMATKILKCENCLEATQAQEFASDYGLVQKKDKGGLIHANSSVVAICKTTEQSISAAIKMTDGLVPFKKNFSLAITSKVLQNVVERYE
jgi:hypothetical protein